MKVQLLRNATLVVTVNNKVLLVDPMLAPKYAYDSFAMTAANERNPTADLPLTNEALNTLIKSVDAVLVSHTHPDHWDAAAKELLPDNMLLFTQPASLTEIQTAGFTNAQAIETQAHWQGIDIYRTCGRHGTGEIGEKMGTVSGFVIKHGGEVLYIAGDTIWCEEVQQALDTYAPTQVIVNGGGARFVVGDPIVMNVPDVVAVAKHLPQARIYVVHLNALNHCQESRADVREALSENGFAERCYVPEDGEVFI